jgi:hypothetical protein
LTEIYINNNCGVNDAWISELENLIIINASNNPKIKNLVRKQSGLKNLPKLILIIVELMNKEFTNY